MNDENYKNKLIDHTIKTINNIMKTKNPEKLITPTLKLLEKHNILTDEIKNIYTQIQEQYNNELKTINKEINELKKLKTK